MTQSHIPQQPTTLQIRAGSATLGPGGGYVSRPRR
jgi:hypothetical protein